MKLVQSSDLMWQPYTHPREGTVGLKVLAEGEASPGMNFFFIMVRYGLSGDTFRTPRHRHTFEQVRFSLEGALNYATGRDLPEGWLGYFPAGAFYGPQVVESGTLLAVQFGRGYLSEEEKARAQRELAAEGRFHNGIYSRTDPRSGRQRNTDGMEAMWTHIHGKPLEYPEPRYREPVLVNPRAFTWVEYGPGILSRHLGTFTEHGLTLRMVKWDDVASLDLATGRSQLLYAIAGDLTVSGEHMTVGAAGWSDYGEQTTVEGVPGTELMVWDLPTTAT